MYHTFGNFSSSHIGIPYYGCERRDINEEVLKDISTQLVPMLLNPIQKWQNIFIEN